MGAPSSSALPPGALGHTEEPEHGPGTKPKGVRGEARQVAGAADRSQAHSGDRHPLLRRWKSRGASGAQEAAAQPLPAPARALLWVHRRVPLPLWAQ